MSEAEILELSALARSNLISAIQWWASVTFGLIALAHFGRKTLNLPLVIIVISLYVAFSGWVGNLVVAQIAELGDLAADLRSLATDSYELSQTGSSLALGLSPSSAIAISLLAAVAIFGTFFSGIGYLIWTYRSRSAERCASQDTCEVDDFRK